MFAPLASRLARHSALRARVVSAGLSNDVSALRTQVSPQTQTSMKTTPLCE
jgi:hypothetical protein